MPVAMPVAMPDALRVAMNGGMIMRLTGPGSGAIIPGRTSGTIDPTFSKPLR